MRLKIINFSMILSHLHHLIMRNKLNYKNNLSEINLNKKTMIKQ